MNSGGTRKNTPQAPHTDGVYTCQRDSGTHIQVWPQLDEEAFPLEAQLAHFRPVEGVNLCVSLQ